MAAPIEAAKDRPVGLYAVTADAALWWREPAASARWTSIGPAPEAVAMAASNYSLFIATRHNRLWARPTAGGGTFYGRTSGTPTTLSPWQD